MFDRKYKIINLTKIIIIAGTFFVSSCASQIMKGFVGSTLSDPILRYGPPSTAFDMGDGRRAFVWSMNNQTVIPGHVSTAGSAYSTNNGTLNFIGSNSSAYNGSGNTNYYSNTTITPPATLSYTCRYVLFATKIRSDIVGPAAWKVVGYQTPKLSCQ